MIRALQFALDQWFADSPEAKHECAALEGRTVAVELTDLDLSFLLCPGPGGLRIAPRGDAEPDATISGKSFDLLRLSRSTGTRGAGGRVDIRGDAELGERFRAILRMARPDPEERLARVIGDIPAHEIGRVMRGLVAFGQDASERFARMVAEHVQYETRDLPARHEVDTFVAGVDALRDAVDRAEAKLKDVGADL